MTGVGFRAHVEIASRIVSYRNSLSRPKNRLRAHDLAAVWGRNCKFFSGGGKNPPKMPGINIVRLYIVYPCAVSAPNDITIYDQANKAMCNSTL